MEVNLSWKEKERVVAIRNGVSPSLFEQVWVLQEQSMSYEIICSFKASSFYSLKIKKKLAGIIKLQVQLAQVSPNSCSSSDSDWLEAEFASINP